MGGAPCGPTRCLCRLESSVLLAFTPAWGGQVPQSPCDVGDTLVPTSLPDLGVVIAAQTVLSSGV